MGLARAPISWRLSVGAVEGKEQRCLPMCIARSFPQWVLIFLPSACCYQRQKELGRGEVRGGKEGRGEAEQGRRGDHASGNVQLQLAVTGYDTVRLQAGNNLHPLCHRDSPYKGTAPPNGKAWSSTAGPALGMPGTPSMTIPCPHSDTIRSSCILRVCWTLSLINPWLAWLCVCGLVCWYSLGILLVMLPKEPLAVL